LIIDPAWGLMPDMFTLDGVSKSFDGRVAAGPLDLEIAPGRCTVLIGPSGCGKSTLLRLMIGLTTPDSGVVGFEGEVITPDSAPLLRRRMGYVIQDGGLFPHLTARGNAALMARYLGWPDTRIDQRLAELAALTAFPSDGLDRYPAQLSGGQRQRVSLMRALMLDPDVLLLDEPLGALDPVIRFELQDELRGIFRTLGKTVVMVTHDIGEAGFFGDDIVLLRDGAIIQRGEFRALVETPADPFVEKFVHAHRGVADALGGTAT
jgi:osmoprotectant transport system ATP-binding protein